MRYQIKTFKGLDYGRTQKTDNILRQTLANFYNEPTTNLTPNIQSVNEFTRAPIINYNETQKNKLVFNKSNLVYLAILGGLAIYFVFK